MEQEAGSEAMEQLIYQQSCATPDLTLGGDWELEPPPISHDPSRLYSHAPSENPTTRIEEAARSPKMGLETVIEQTSSAREREPKKSNNVITNVSIFESSSIPYTVPQMKQESSHKKSQNPSLNGTTSFTPPTTKIVSELESVNRKDGRERESSPKLGKVARATSNTPGHEKKDQKASVGEGSIRNFRAVADQSLEAITFPEDANRERIQPFQQGLDKHIKEAGEPPSAKARSSSCPFDVECNEEDEDEDILGEETLKQCKDRLDALAKATEVDPTKCTHCYHGSVTSPPKKLDNETIRRNRARLDRIR